MEEFVVTAKAAIVTGKKALINDIFNQIFNFFAVMAYQAYLTKLILYYFILYVVVIYVFFQVLRRISS